MLRREDEWGGAVTAAAFTGDLLHGWGTFNLIEGVVDHHLLNLHHAATSLSTFRRTSSIS